MDKKTRKRRFPPSKSGSLSPTHQSKALEQPYVSPKVDYAFKKIMKNKKALSGFLSAVLHISPSEIKDIVFLDTHTQKRFKDDKFGIMDVHLLLNNNAELNIEIQMQYIPGWTNRTVYYSCDMVVNQGIVGEDYTGFKKCISISILDFNLWSKEIQSNYYSRFHLLEDNRNFVYNDLLEFHVLELRKLPQAQSENDALWLWSKFINAESREEMAELAKKDEHIAEAVNEVNMIFGARDEYDLYVRRRMAIMDEVTIRNFYTKEGEKRGEKKGETKGEKNKAIKIAQKMLAKGRPLDEIAEMTELSEAEIKRLL